MILAPLFVEKGGKKQHWGRYWFDQLPSPQDHINITDYQGRVQCLQVEYIAHEPRSEEQPETDDKITSWVHAQWVEEYY